MNVWMLSGATSGSVSLMKVEDEMREEDEQRNGNGTGWSTETPLALKLREEPRKVAFVFAESLCFSW